MTERNPVDEGLENQENPKGGVAEQTEQSVSGQESAEVRAARAEERAKLMEQQLQQLQTSPPTPQPQVDEVAELSKELAAVVLPDLAPDGSNYWEVKKAEDECTALKFKIAEARDRKRERQLQAMQSGQVVRDFKDKARADPRFLEVEAEFDNLVRQMPAELRSNEQALELSYYSLLGRRSSAPAGPSLPTPGATQVHNPAGGTATKKKQPELSEAEQELAAFYGMTPEEWSDPKYSQPAYGGDGIAIYQFPEGVAERLRHFRRG